MKVSKCLPIWFGFVFLPWATLGFTQAMPDSLRALKQEAPKVFIDCETCDQDFIKTEITFVNYVRDRKEAQVHVLVTTQPTAGGGIEHTLTLIGRQDYSGLSDTLKFVSKQNATDDEIRRALSRTLKIGLMRYISRTPFADRITISYAEPIQPTAVVDRWHSWVFSLSTDGYFNGEKSQHFLSVYGTLSADRITPQWKTNLSIYGSHLEKHFEIADQTISSLSKSRGCNARIVKSLNDHWSAGLSGSAYSSTYSNIKYNVGIAPAIEYDIFPYSQATRRQLRLEYRTGARYNHYYEETIFDKTTETLTHEALSLTVEAREPWGSTSTSLVGSHYFHDFSKNQLYLVSDLSLRLFKGLSLTLYGQTSLIHDQISLPKSGATPEEILLQRKQLATQYYYYVSVGLKYTFGSIFSNVVNPRFGS